MTALSARKIGEVPAILLPGSAYQFGTTKSLGYHPFSNDSRFTPDTLASFQQLRAGLAVHIGAGAMFSLLDKHALQPVLIDYDERVVDVQKLTEDAILLSDNAQSAVKEIAVQGAKILDTTASEVRFGLRTEASSGRLGALHWTRRFAKVKSALKSRPPIYIKSDVRDPLMMAALRLSSTEYGPVKLFNLSNVHNHLEGVEENMEFIRHFPLADPSELQILYSDSDDGDYNLFYGRFIRVLKRHSTSDIGRYLEFAVKPLSQSSSSLPR